MRKALKRLRYQAEFFAPLFAKLGTERFIERLKKLQDVFGYTNDVRMARNWSSCRNRAAPVRRRRERQATLKVS